MGLGSWFRRRKSGEERPEGASGPAQARELREAWSALEASQFERAISSAAPYLERQGALGLEAAKITGLAHFRNGDYASAVAHLRRVAQGRDRPEDWFNLATSAILAGEMETAQDAMRRALDGAERSGARSTSSSALRTTPSSTYAACRCLSHTMELALVVLRGLGSEFPAREWIADFASHVDEEGAAFLRQFAERLDESSG